MVFARVVAVPNTFPSYGAGYLGGEYNPFIAGDPNVTGYKVRDITLPSDVDWARVRQRAAGSSKKWTRSIAPSMPIRISTRSIHSSSAPMI